MSGKMNKAIKAGLVALGLFGAPAAAYAARNGDASTGSSNGSSQGGHEAGPCGCGDTPGEKGQSGDGRDPIKVSKVTIDARDYPNGPFIGGKKGASSATNQQCYKAQYALSMVFHETRDKDGAGDFFTAGALPRDLMTRNMSYNPSGFGQSVVKFSNGSQTVAATFEASVQGRPTSGQETQVKEGPVSKFDVTILGVSKNELLACGGFEKGIFGYKSKPVPQNASRIEPRVMRPGG